MTYTDILVEEIHATIRALKQAIRDAALEEAAQIAEGSVAYTNTSPHQLWQGHSIAAAVRALKEQP